MIDMYRFSACPAPTSTPFGLFPHPQSLCKTPVALSSTENMDNHQPQTLGSVDPGSIRGLVIPMTLKEGAFPSSQLRTRTVVKSNGFYSVQLSLDFHSVKRI